MPAADLEKVIRVWRDRLVDLTRDQRFKYILIFKNYGAAAGASLSHPHSQIIATPVTPLTLAGELTSAKEHYQDKERCLFCDMIQQELESGERIVLVQRPVCRDDALRLAVPVRDLSGAAIPPSQLRRDQRLDDPPSRARAQGGAAQDQDVPERSALQLPYPHDPEREEPGPRGMPTGTPSKSTITGTSRSCRG